MNGSSTMGSLSILVLEDHAFQRSEATQMLHELGYTEILEAASGSETLSLLQSVGRVDLLLCDLTMDSIKLLRTISASGLVSNVAICTNLSTDLLQTAAQIGSLLGFKVAGVLPKPLQMGQLKLLLDHIAKPFREEIASIFPVLRLQNEADICWGLLHHEFVAYYQPKLSLKNNRVLGFEVQACWLHPRHGLLSSASFIEVAAACGLLLDELFFSMFEQGLRFQRECLSRGVSLNFSFNLHASQLIRNELLQRIQMQLKKHRASARKITFEIMGSEKLNTSRGLDGLLQLRKVGFTLSIDEFGSDLATLQHLCQLPFKEVKLDDVFIRNLEGQADCVAKIENISSLTCLLGMDLVVSGIESSKQHQLITSLGGDQGQGSFYGGPMASDDAILWLCRPREVLQ